MHNSQLTYLGIYLSNHLYKCIDVYVQVFCRNGVNCQLYSLVVVSLLVIEEYFWTNENKYACLAEQNFQVIFVHEMFHVLVQPQSTSFAAIITFLNCLFLQIWFYLNMSRTSLTLEFFHYFICLLQMTTTHIFRTTIFYIFHTEAKYRRAQ